MCEPFIRNHQYNFIKNQAESVLNALRTVGDPKILESVRFSAQTKVAELFPAVTDNRKTMLDSISDLKTTDDFQTYLQALEPYLIEFPQITEKQIRKLFPKNKKLKVPDLAQIDLRYVSCLSWTDISTNKMFIVYSVGGQFVGVEGRYTATNKKGYCFVCSRYEELALFSAISKKRPANASPDYYKSVGNYLCMNGHECNKNMTDVTSLEKFIDSVQG
ncbi:FusB/FusC family EF-G-binding protein [Paenibacillus radicis (ex Xue et al. 2023)]|uniref:FusB/FusC family EF-G-binding protein n=1 Tax=Paenibacillus radicis (ex Xue et al. 2023) TaxID=2972489 RepID=A0ABT1YCW8_9BACL|nr:FusB/FusC family EF-G-binding protein [Paenibacillus radicis (ex Xue et al. 2023)]MCR8631011.1 FusB/FusC family EF-G-binding protein [Paenibacillus radicis (ex Xue et al. 2023)]